MGKYITACLSCCVGSEGLNGEAYYLGIWELGIVARELEKSIILSKGEESKKNFLSWLFDLKLLNVCNVFSWAETLSMFGVVHCGKICHCSACDIGQGYTGPKNRWSGPGNQTLDPQKRSCCTGRGLNPGPTKNDCVLGQGFKPWTARKDHLYNHARNR